MNKDRLRRTSLNYEIENHCTSAMLVEVIRSVKQRSRAWFRDKKSSLTVKKCLCYRLKSPHVFSNALIETMK